MVDRDVGAMPAVVFYETCITNKCPTEKINDKCARTEKVAEYGAVVATHMQGKICPT